MATVCHKQQTIKSNRRLTACIRTAIATAKGLRAVAQSLICSAEYLLKADLARCLPFVRFRGQSGHGSVMTLRLLMTRNDIKPPSLRT